MPTLTTNLKLRISDDLTADARYNLERLDLVGINMDFSNTNEFILRSREGITIQPNDNDLGGDGSGGIVNIGASNQPIDQLNINAGTTCIHGELTLAEIPTLEGLKLKADAKIPNSNFLQIVAPAGLNSNIILTLPTEQSGIDQVLSNDGTGTLSWVSIATDSLSTNHIRIGDASGISAQVDVNTVGDISASVAAGLRVKSQVLTDIHIADTAAIDADKIDDSTSTNKFVTEAITQAISTNSTNIANNTASINSNTQATTDLALTTTTSITDLQSAIDLIPIVDLVTITSDDLVVTQVGSDFTINLPEEEVIVGSEDFFVSGSTPLPQQDIANNNFATILFSVPTQGADIFDGSTFTAPVTGVYLFEVSALFGSDIGRGIISRFRVNGINIVGLNSTNIHEINKATGTVVLSLAAGDTVDYQAGAFRESFLGIDASTDGNITAFTPVGLDITTGPFGSFNVIFLGEETSAHVVYGQNLINPTGNINTQVIQGNDLGAPLFIDNIVLDTQNTFDGTTFTPKVDGVYRFHTYIDASDAFSIQDSAVNFRVSRANGSQEVYQNNNDANKNTDDDNFDRSNAQGNMLIDLVVGDSVEIFYLLSATVSGGTVVALPARADTNITIARVSDISSYVNSQSNPTGSIPLSSSTSLDFDQESVDTLDQLDMGSLTIDSDGIYFLKAQIGYNKANAATAIAIAMYVNGILRDANAGGRTGSSGGGFIPENTISVDGTYRLSEGDIVTYDLVTEASSVSPTYRSAFLVGGTMFIPSYIQAVKAINDSPPVVASTTVLASEIPYSNSISQLVATQVQAAIDELAARPSVTVSSQFKARKTANQSIPTGDTDVSFPLEIYDTNNDYNTATGVFTSPVSGLYTFTAFVSMDINSNSMELFFTVNGGFQDINESDSETDGQYITITTSFMLAAGDQVKVQANGDTTAVIEPKFSGRSCAFMGHLVRQV